MYQALSVEGLSKTYSSWRGEDVEAVRDIDLSIDEGEIVGLLGHY